MRWHGPPALALALVLLASACERETVAPDPGVAQGEDEAGQGEADAAPSEQRVRLERMLKANPDNGGVLYVFARSAASRGELAETLAYLERLLALESWDYPLELRDFGALGEEPQVQALAEQLAARAPKVSHGPVGLELPVVDILPEGIAWDAAGERLLVGSMRQRKILVVDAEGEARDLVAPQTAGLLGVLGIEVDAARGWVWAAAASAPFIEDYAPEAGDPGGIWAFDLADGSVRAKVLASDPPVQLNDLAVLADGRVVATDSLNARLLVHTPGSEGFTVLAGEGELFAPNGIVAVPGEAAVHVADFQGVHRVEIDGGASVLLAPPAGVASLGGIDGLDRQGEVLVAVQNLFSPGRVWALRLAEDGRSFEDARILDDSHPRAEGPTTGAFVGQGRYWYMGNASMQFGPQGMLEAEEGAVHVLLQLEL